MFAEPAVGPADISRGTGTHALSYDLAVAPRRFRHTQQGKPEPGEIEKQEKLRLTVVVADDHAVLPGLVATEDVMARNKAKSVLLEVIQRFAMEGFPSAEDEGKISKETAEAATVLFNALPLDAKLPKIAPDCDGGLMAVWEDEDNPVVLVVVDWSLHLVTAAATPRAKYFDDLPFDGEHVPPPVFEAIPKH
jgi:hypothetical protein